MQTPSPRCLVSHCRLPSSNIDHPRPTLIRFEESGFNFIFTRFTREIWIFNYLTCSFSDLSSKSYISYCNIGQFYGKKNYQEMNFIIKLDRTMSTTMSSKLGKKIHLREEGQWIILRLLLIRLARHNYSPCQGTIMEITKRGSTRVRVLFVEKDARGRLFFPAAQSLSRWFFASTIYPPSLISLLAFLHGELSSLSSLTPSMRCK